MKGLNINKKGHQLTMVLLNHLYTCVAMLMIEFAFFAWSIGMTPAQEIISTITILFYIGVVYVKANEIATHDRKPYSELELDTKKAFLWGGCIVAITYILYALYAVVAKDGSAFPVWIKAIVSLIFNLWTMPYMGIMGAARGQIMWYSHIFWIIVPFLGLVPGYITGKKKIFLINWINKIVYKNAK